ncbi:hypothetical protein [Spiroplasma endosymbiont of Polydrusus formosus]|uniref:hypothetical protein n=1 Tax=Spiroplasma endosymbiont of Polydrusus formosus TaxID=3139326 RepID=UPI0035B50CC1
MIRNIQKYTHVKYDEQNLFKDLLLFDTCKKKNGTVNLSEIARQMGIVVLILLKEKSIDLKR